MRTLLVGLVVSLAVSSVFAQQKPRPHEQCIKQVPGDWGPNFGDKWHDNEARYWACRNGVPVETIKAWQRAADEEDMATEIKPVTVDGQNLVLFVKDGGTANCYSLSVLRQAGNTWTNAWEMPTRKGDDEGYYCTGHCPALEARTDGEILTVRSASSSDPNDESCKHVHWANDGFAGTVLPLCRSNNDKSQFHSNAYPA
ncbi:MAG TPA: hypothetical protein VGS27_29010 [Candidatus Sulfotelmatobacter sp.]|nr:hypothetical protein [Candidatus Sulfotelmatobacter sp.]